MKRLTVWSRSRFGEWCVERSYEERYVRGPLAIPEGGGRVGPDGRYYIALPEGAMPSDLVRHPDVAASGEVPIPLARRRAS